MRGSFETLGRWFGKGARRIGRIVGFTSGLAADWGLLLVCLWAFWRAFLLLPAEARAQLLQPTVWPHIPTGAVWGVLAGWDVINTVTLNSIAGPALLAYVAFAVGLVVVSNGVSYARQRPSNVTAWAAVAFWFVALALSLADIIWLSGQPSFWRASGIGGQSAGFILRMAEAGSLIGAFAYQMPLAFNRVSPQHAQPIARVMWRLFVWSIAAATLIPVLLPIFDRLITPEYHALLHARSSTDRTSEWLVLGTYLLIACVTIGTLALKPLKLLASVITALLLTRPLIQDDSRLLMPSHRGSR